jgi:hypothetical protein
MWFIPENDVGWNGTESGYVKEVIHFEFTEDLVKDVSLAYFEYDPSLRGDIYGRVVYEGGPKDGEGASAVKVELLLGSAALQTITTNGTGHYRFESVIFMSPLTIRITPLEEDIGEMDARSGYLPKTTPEFNHIDGDHEENVILEYYEMGVEEHPSVTILDEDGDPISDVVVVVNVGDDMYVAMTDENGTAEFDELSGAEFPDGAAFKASKEGYGDVEWAQGDEIPEMVEEKEEEEESNDIFLILVIILIIIIVLVVIFIVLRRGGAEEDYEE